MEKIILRNGVEVSSIGFGTYPLKAYQIIRIVPNLSKYGITLVDTAHDYDNERLIGVAGKMSNAPLFYCTKMSVKQQKARNARGGVYKRGIFTEP